MSQGDNRRDWQQPVATEAFGPQREGKGKDRDSGHRAAGEINEQPAELGQELSGVGSGWR